MTLGAQGGAALGGLALAFAVGRIGGPEELGRFTVMVSLIGALGMLARRGQGVLLTRAAAWAAHKDGRRAAVSLLVLAVRRIFVPSIAVGVVGSVLLWSGVVGAPFPGSIWALPAALLLTTALAVFSGYTRGTGRPWLAPFFEMGGVSLFTVLILIATFVVCGRPVGHTVMAVFLAAMTLLAAVAVLIARRDLPGTARLPVATDDQYEELRRGQIAFTIIALGSFLIQSGSFVLAAPFLTESDVGLLRAAERLALLVSFPVLAINPVIVSRVVPAVRDGNHRHLCRLIRAAMLASGGIGAAILLALLVWPERALTLMGMEFGAAAGFLRVMALAQFMAAVLAPLAMLLNMSGREHASMWINLGALALALVLIPVLCMAYGSTGFVIAYAVIIVTRVCVIGVVAMSESLKQSSLYIKLKQWAT